MDPAGGNSLLPLGRRSLHRNGKTHDRENGVLYRESHQVEGYVDGTPEINEYGMRFILKVKNIAIFDSDVLKTLKKLIPMRHMR